MFQRHSGVSRAGKFTATSLIVAASALYSVQASAAGFNVEVNQSRALKLDEPAAAVMVGNPAIADVTVLGPQLIYVLGRSYGKTNFVALDAKGKQISAFDVNVVAQADSTVTLTRGAGQLTYNCTPRCERVVSQGDEPDAFSAAAQQSMGVAAIARSMSMDAAGQQGGTGTVIGPAVKAEVSTSPVQ
ncbi:MAG: pilus assembly protein N-terminal domain-containing protein [Parvibaculaceae bacterium]